MTPGWNACDDLPQQGTEAVDVRLSGIGSMRVTEYLGWEVGETAIYSRIIVEASSSVTP